MRMSPNTWPQNSTISPRLASRSLGDGEPAVTATRSPPRRPGGAHTSPASNPGSRIRRARRAEEPGAGVRVGAAGRGTASGATAGATSAARVRSATVKPSPDEVPARLQLGPEAPASGPDLLRGRRSTLRGVIARSEIEPAPHRREHRARDKPADARKVGRESTERELCARQHVVTTSRRTCGPSSSSKKSSRSRARRRATGSAGYSAGSGKRRSSASMIRVESPIASPSSTSTGNVRSPVSRSAIARCAPRGGCAAHVRNALVVERPACLLVVVRHLQVPEEGTAGHAVAPVTSEPMRAQPLATRGA